MLLLTQWTLKKSFQSNPKIPERAHILSKPSTGRAHYWSLEPIRLRSRTIWLYWAHSKGLDSCSGNAIETNIGKLNLSVFGKCADTISNTTMSVSIRKCFASKVYGQFSLRVWIAQIHWGHTPLWAWAVYFTKNQSSQRRSRTKKALILKTAQIACCIRWRFHKGILKKVYIRDFSDSSTLLAVLVLNRTTLGLSFQVFLKVPWPEMFLISIRRLGLSFQVFLKFPWPEMLLFSIRRLGLSFQVFRKVLWPEMFLISIRGYVVKPKFPVSERIFPLPFHSPPSYQVHSAGFLLCCERLVQESHDLSSLVLRNKMKKKQPR